MVYRHGLCRKVFYSEIVKAMIEAKKAYWLIDAIASHVAANPKFKTACKKDERFHDMQIWILRKNDAEDGPMAELIAVADTDKRSMSRPKIKQEIPFTDFEFENGDKKLYCGFTQIGDEVGYLIYDPSEY